jgi:predicted  nucleic acid-binding Zn-ribbon protein
MKTINLRYVLFAALVLWASTSFGQEADETETVPMTLPQQFQDLKEKSNTYKSSSNNQYKVVRLTLLNQFWTNISDSLTDIRQELRETQGQVATQEAEIRSLNSSIREKDAIVAASEHDSTHITVLGMDIPKEGFLNFFWITVLILALLLGAAIYQYRNSQRVTSRTRQDYRKLQHELEEFRKSSLEKERRLRRELQTERNLVEELKVVASQKR